MNERVNLPRTTRKFYDMSVYEMSLKLMKKGVPLFNRASTSLLLIDIWDIKVVSRQ